MPGEPRVPTGRRIAVVGCGAAGRMHLETLERAGVAPAALVDADADRREALGRRWPGALVAPSVEAVVDAVDAAIVAVPDRAHASVATELLRAGKDVLVEKPLACTRPEAETMVAVARDAERVLAVAQVRRHLAVKAWAFAVLRSGVLGAVERVDAAQGGSDDWVPTTSAYIEQAAGGVIATQGAHSIDLLVWWFGPLTVVSCVDDARGGREADATIELTATGIPVHLELSRIRSKRNTIRISTERGLLEVALDHYQPRQLLAAPAGVELPPFAEVVDDMAVQFDRQWRAFTEAREGRWPPTLATGADGVAVVGVLEDCCACRTTELPWWMDAATARA